MLDSYDNCSSKHTYNVTILCGQFPVVGIWVKTYYMELALAIMSYSAKLGIKVVQFNNEANGILFNQWFTQSGEYKTNHKFGKYKQIFTQITT